MLGTAVIVFREVLEAALIISIMLAATRGMLGRGRWVLTGLASGLSGAVLLALLADRINNAIAGTGQEVINATILFTAVAMLTWHLVWMRKHAAQLTHQIRRVGAAVLAGEKAPTALAVIVGLAVLREGSELVLFLHGIAASGSGTNNLLFGSLIGLGAGAFIGIVLYLGLLRIPIHHLFRVTGWLILLLAAGLAAQASGYLVQANLVPSLGERIWDSSAILSQQSVLGQFFHITLGYLDRPMGIQLLVYIATLVGILMLTRLVNSGQTRPTPSKAVTVVCMLCITLLFVPRESRASHKVYSPKVEQGEVELEVRGHRTFDNDAAKSGQEKFKVEAGYGVTDYWFTSVFGEIEKSDSGSYKYEATAWENIFQLTEQGKYWVDVGLYLEYEHPRDAAANDQLEVKFLLEKMTGKFVHTANLVFAREVAGSSKATNFEYAWRTKYLMDKHFEPGFEIYGEMGEVGHVSPSDQQDHRIGPVVYGEFASESKSKWKYELGYLFGIRDAAPDGTLKALLEYEFRF